MVLGGVALAVGFLVTMLTAFSTAAPVLAVRRALRRVERGDYDAEVPVFDTTELGLLQAGFNTMVSGLRERVLMNCDQAGARRGKPPTSKTCSPMCF